MNTANTQLQVSTRIVGLQPGLYAFRYQTGKSQADQQYAATLALGPIGSGQVEFFGSGKASNMQLQHHEDCVVVRVSIEPASVLIAEYFQDQAALNSRVEIIIDRLDGDRSRKSGQLPTGAAAAPALPYSPKTLSAFGELLPLGLLGHIERRGDVKIAEGWLGDPEGSARLEGFMAEWPQSAPANLELSYGCATGGQSHITMVPAGSFAGTRGKAMAINALCFDLKGKDSHLYKLIGQAVFAGSAPQTIQLGKVLSGPSGNEPLLAIYLVAIRTPQKAAAKKKASTWEDPAVTQIFSKRKKK
jgi:hypothetical protein